MTFAELAQLLQDVQADYIRMVHDLNRLKHSSRPVDPWKLPLVERMEKAKRDLATAQAERNANLRAAEDAIRTLAGYPPSQP